MKKIESSWATFTHHFWHESQGKVRSNYWYMNRLQEKWQDNTRYFTKGQDAAFNEPLSFKQGEIILIDETADFLNNEVDQWRNEAWEVIKGCPQHLWLIMVDDPNRLPQCLPSDWTDNYPHVLFGVRIEKKSDLEKVQFLSDVVAIRRFICAEPLIGDFPLTYENEFGEKLIDEFEWCIIGGEKANPNDPYAFRPCQLEWINKLVDSLQKEAPHVKIHISQLGKYLQMQLHLKSENASDSGEFPEHLKIRNLPSLSEEVKVSGTTAA